MAWLFNKSIELSLFCIAHFAIRPVCDKQFHCSTNNKCLAVTFTVIAVATIVILPIQISLLSSILIAFFEVYFGYLVQSKIDSEHKDIYAMNEKELYEHCRACGLSEEDCRIAYFVVRERLRGQELYSAIGYSERQTKRKRKQILDKIK